MLEFSQTVPCERVHRSAVSEVFVTSAQAIDEDTFLVGAQLPRCHAFYGDTAQTYDPLLLLEICRQASLLLAHDFLDVEIGARFLVRTIELTTIDTTGFTGNVVLHCVVLQRFQRDGVLIGLRVRYTVEIAGRDIAETVFSFSWCDGNEWVRMRRGRHGAPGLPGPRADSALVGRRHPRNVVIGPPRPHGPDSYRADLVIDTGHPTLFDHPLDHVPSALELEAIRQVAIVTASAITGLSPGGLRIATLAVRFTRFVELDMTAICEATSTRGDDGLSIDAVVTQDGRTSAVARLMLPLPRLDFQAVVSACQHG